MSVPEYPTKVQSDQIIVAQEKFYLVIGRVSEGTRRGAHVGARLTPRIRPALKGLDAGEKRRASGKKWVVDTDERGVDEVLKEQ